MYKTRFIPTLTGEAAERFTEWQHTASTKQPSFDVMETLSGLQTILSRIRED